VAAITITPEDLEPFATIDRGKAQAMIADALAMAALVAPCILEDDFAYPEAALAIIRRAILRWNEGGSGALTQQGAGPFQMTVDNRQPQRSLFWPSEITQLQELCADSDLEGQAFTINTTPAASRATDGYWGAPDVWVDI